MKLRLRLHRYYRFHRELHILLLIKMMTLVSLRVLQVYHVIGQNFKEKTIKLKYTSIQGKFPITRQEYMRYWKGNTFVWCVTLESSNQWCWVGFGGYALRCNGLAMDLPQHLHNAQWSVVVTPSMLLCASHRDSRRLLPIFPWHLHLPPPHLNTPVPPLLLHSPSPLVIPTLVELPALLPLIITCTSGVHPQT